MKHADVWRAIDRLASINGWSASGLARRSGLDPTSFNKSKRQSHGGKPRWPSTESVAKVLAATKAGMGEFVSLMGEDRSHGLAQRFALVTLSDCQRGGQFSKHGKLEKANPEEVLVPNVQDPDAFALKIDNDVCAPFFRDGDIVIVSPNAAVRKGDRVAVGLTSGRVLLKSLARTGPVNIELHDLPAASDYTTTPKSDVAWLARIVWASQ